MTSRCPACHKPVSPTSEDTVQCSGRLLIDEAEPAIEVEWLIHQDCAAKLMPSMSGFSIADEAPGATYRIRGTGCLDACPDWDGFKTREKAQAEADRWQELLDPKEHLLIVEPEEK